MIRSYFEKKAEEERLRTPIWGRVKKLPPGTVINFYRWIPQNWELLREWERPFSD